MPADEKTKRKSNNWMKRCTMMKNYTCLFCLRCSVRVLKSIRKTTRVKPVGYATPGRSLHISANVDKVLD